MITLLFYWSQLICSLGATGTEWRLVRFVFSWLRGLLNYCWHPVYHCRAFLMKDVIHTSEKGSLYNMALPGEDIFHQMGKYSLSGRLVENFSCSESFLPAIQQAVLWAIFKICWEPVTACAHRQGCHSALLVMLLCLSPLQKYHVAWYRKSNELLPWVQILSLTLKWPGVNTFGQVS